MEIVLKEWTVARHLLFITELLEQANDPIALIDSVLGVVDTLLTKNVDATNAKAKVMNPRVRKVSFLAYLECIRTFHYFY